MTRAELERELRSVLAVGRGWALAQSGWNASEADDVLQASVLKLFRNLQETFALTYLFISHDLAVIRAMCQRVAVMYLGQIVESGETRALFERPRLFRPRRGLEAGPSPAGRVGVEGELGDDEGFSAHVEGGPVHFPVLVLEDPESRAALRHPIRGAG